MQAGAGALDDGLSLFSDDDASVHPLRGPLSGGDDRRLETWVNRHYNRAARKKVKASTTAGTAAGSIFGLGSSLYNFVLVQRLGEKVYILAFGEPTGARIAFLASTMSVAAFATLPLIALGLSNNIDVFRSLFHRNSMDVRAARYPCWSLETARSVSLKLFALLGGLVSALPLVYVNDVVFRYYNAVFAMVTDIIALISKTAVYGWAIHKSLSLLGSKLLSAYHDKTHKVSAKKKIRTRLNTILQHLDHPQMVAILGSGTESKLSVLIQLSLKAEALLDSEENQEKKNRIDVLIVRILSVFVGYFSAYVIQPISVKAMNKVYCTIDSLIKNAVLKPCDGDTQPVSEIVGWLSAAGIGTLIAYATFLKLPQAYTLITTKIYNKCCGAQADDARDASLLAQEEGQSDSDSSSKSSASGASQEPVINKGSASLPKPVKAFILVLSLATPLSRSQLVFEFVNGSFLYQLIFVVSIFLATSSKDFFSLQLFLQRFKKTPSSNKAVWEKFIANVSQGLGDLEKANRTSLATKLIPQSPVFRGDDDFDDDGLGPRPATVRPDIFANNVGGTDAERTAGARRMSQSAVTSLG